MLSTLTYISTFDIMILSLNKENEMNDEPNHAIWYRSDAEQMLKDGIIDEHDLAEAEIIDDYVNDKCCICGNEGKFIMGDFNHHTQGFVCMNCQNLVEMN